MTDDTTTTAVEEPAPASGDMLTVLLEHVKQARGFDFTGYKRSSVERRIAKQMDAVGVPDYSAYIEYLELNPDEYARLFDTLLINVTTFFRDRASWDFLTSEILPRLLERKGPDAPLRVWCAGCASGEEAYSIAIALVEAMGVEAFLRRVKIYATDADEDALATARNGSYMPRQVDGVPEQMLERYFERADQQFTFRKDLRRAVIFGRNDLVQDAPISRIDLLICRNTLMYFNAETQGRIVGRFNFALDPDGFLFLGRSEMLITHTALFTPVNLKRRVFAKVAQATLRERLVTPAHANGERAGATEGEIHKVSFDVAPTAQIVVDSEGLLALANGRARMLLGLGADDLGRPLKDLDIAYRPVELLPAIDRALAQRRPLTLGPASWAAIDGELLELETQIAPLSASEPTGGVSVAYIDVTAETRMRTEVEQSRRELDAAFEELQTTVEELETTNDELQSTVEELETTNEELQTTVEELQSTTDELQSTVEELETTNEELQSTNEELETTNEELQSTVEELAATNEELHQRTVELDEVNAFLETILTSLGVAVVVLDRRRQITVWNTHAEKLWGLRQEAIGQQFLALDIGLPVEKLKAPIRQALEDATFHARLTLDATTRRGAAIECDVTCLPLALHDGQVAGAILLIEPREGPAATA